jgi:2-oxoisovalerate dehydrogenase E1 component alpha subunit
VERLKNYLIGLGEWSEERHAALAQEMDEQVQVAWKEAVTYGTLTGPPRLNAHLMFEDVFKEMPEHLKIQETQLQAELAGK